LEERRGTIRRHHKKNQRESQTRNHGGGLPEKETETRSGREKGYEAGVLSMPKDRAKKKQNTKKTEFR